MATYRFDEIAINSTKKKKPTEEDKVHYIGLEHIDPGCFNIVRWGSDVAPTGDKLLMQKGDVLFGKRRAYQRKVGIAPFDGIFSAHGMVLRPNTEIIDANYFPFFISSDRFMETAVRISVGGLSPTINWKDLAKQKFDLPTLEEQKVLADKLWAAYRLKEGYKKLLAATDEMVKSQFIEMFKNSEKIALGNMATFVNGSAFKPDDWSTEGVPIVRIQNLTQDDSTYNYYNGDMTKKVIIDSGDIIISWSATLGVFFWNRGRALLNQHIFKVLFNKVNVNKEFFVYTVRLALDEMADIAHGSTMRHIVKKDFDGTMVAYPDYEEQERFASIVKQADKSKSYVRIVLKNLESMLGYYKASSLIK